MSLRHQERIGLFIDGPSLNRAARALQINIDYKRLLMLFQQRGRLIRAHYYDALPAGQTDNSPRPLLDWLSYNGYKVVTRTSRDVTDATSRLALAIELAVDAMLLAEHLDHFVLFSGSGELQSLVQALQTKGRRVSIVSTIRSQPALVADELRRQGDTFLELDDLRPVIGYDAENE